MTMLCGAFLLATFTMLVGGSTILHTPTFLYPPMLHQAPTVSHKPIALPTTFLEHWRPVRVVPLGRDDSLACSASGFYQHPTNCSRFYRCVDFAGTKQIFSQYLFECPKGHVFSADVSTCLPGSCSASLPIATPHSSTQPTGHTPDQSTEAPVQPTTEFSVPPTTEFSVPPTTEFSVPPTTDFPSPPTTESPAQPDGSFPTELPAEGGEVVGVTEAPGQVATEPVTTPSTTVPVTDTPTTQACTPLYVQHASYCNVYISCNDSKRFVCPAGTVFDQPRQMCRISAVDESLCVGKAILQSSFLRTELVDGHILLPESLKLPPLDVNQPLHIVPNPALTVLTKARPLVTFPDVRHLVPVAGFLRHPQPHFANTFTYFSHRRKRVA